MLKNVSQWQRPVSKSDLWRLKRPCLDIISEGESVSHQDATFDDRPWEKWELHLAAECFLETLGNVEDLTSKVTCATQPATCIFLNLGSQSACVTLDCDTEKAYLSFPLRILINRPQHIDFSTKLPVSAARCLVTHPRYKLQQASRGCVLPKVLPSWCDWIF